MSCEELLNLLEEKATLIQKTQVNLKKCPKQRLTKGYIEIRIQSLCEDWQAFKAYHEALVKCLPKEKRKELSYFTNEDFYTVEDLYLSITADLKDMLNTFNTHKEFTTSTPNQTIEQGTLSSIRLPNIVLPRFTGNYEEWPAYCDLFTSLVHSNMTLTNVQKLHYLKSSISGEAEALLRHIQITENNYEQAWNTLKQRFGSKRLIVNSLLKRLFGQKKIMSPTAMAIKSLLDTTAECLNGLNNLQVASDSWDPMIIYIVIQKLDVETHKAWEDNVYSPDSANLPTWRQLRDFLEARFRTMELVNPNTTRENKPNREKTFHISAPDSSTRTCTLCNEGHTLCHCKEFIKLSPMERSEFVREKNLCYNCLIPGHSSKGCRLRVSCKICNKRHHSLLHQMKPKYKSDDVQTHHTQVIEGNEEEVSELDQPTVAISSNTVTKRSTALLATALIPVKDTQGKITVLRALIDQGSQANFISERAAQTLKIKRTTARGIITGVGSTQTEVKHVIKLQLLSRYDEQFKLTVNTYVMPTRLTSQLPAIPLLSLTHAWPRIKNLFLADPSFSQPGRIDLLLGVEVYANILKNNLIRNPKETLCAQETSFGWILFGEITSNTSDTTITVMHHQIENDDFLYKLWEIDSNEKSKLTKEEETCQKIYETTVKRNEEGRYIVRLPLKHEPPRSTEGNTRDTAMKRLQQLEKRLANKPSLQADYKNALNEYLTLGYMEEVPEMERENPSVYLPHHAVVKESSETTKTRVVFNASSLDTNNISLNDDLLVGPQLQEDLRSLFIRWRLGKVAFVADIQKMYLQILVSKENADYQRILWRDHPTLAIKDYRLLRLTFGTASAPYLAVRTLHQVAADEGNEHPDAAETIKSDFFMDDLMSSSDTEVEAINTAKNITKILERGGFCLRKWMSNSVKFRKEFNPKEINTNVVLNAGETVRTLGMTWNLKEDKLQYLTTLPPLRENYTKRNILAEIQHVFDPLGWLTPALLPAKLMLQKLWIKGVTWDETLEPEIKEEWLEIRNDLDNLHKVQKSRWLNTSKDNLPNVTIHGFCDASNKAYGAVAYLRAQQGDGHFTIKLIAARSRVAPLKPVSLPRLELCGAVLLSKLLRQISEATRIPLAQVFAWTDSTIVLSWLRGDPARWKTFVRNRVVTILDNVGHKWFHVSSPDNPADIASRGMSLNNLENCSLWWDGPSWLQHDEIEEHEIEDTLTDLEEKESFKINAYLNIKDQKTNEVSILTQFEEFETLNELIKTITYCKRFLRYKKYYIESTPITSTEELNEALEDCVRIVQNHEFAKEIEDLKYKKYVSMNSKIKSLNPFVDENNILRVGGRLRHAEMSHDNKYPMILANKNPLSLLIVSDAHKRTLHGGIQMTMNYVRSKFWIIRLKTLVSTTIHKCLICAKQRSITRTQKMGDLPKARVTPARPFYNSGVDFAGPLKILISKGRGYKCTKGYICVFICMATKAIHLELVGDLSTESFIAAFKRFVARRGRCCHLWSDRGTNFVGASTELRDRWTNAQLELPTNLIQLLAEDGTQWHFNPPYSPNFGGLWEAGVKSVKHHLRRILTSNLTYEELSTTLCQVEACLNSRPLCPIGDSNTDDLKILTPGHFLIGEPLITVPEPNLQDVNLNRLSRWQHCQKILQDFWNKWQTEYLTRLQQRPKWLCRRQEFEVGDIVLVKEDHLPPGKWALGRITERHPGADNICRVYSLKSNDKIIKRPGNRLCELPIDNN